MPKRNALPRSSSSLFVISQEVDLVAGVFNGTAWRHVLLTKHFWTVSCLRHRAPPLWRPGSIPDIWADVCGFLNPFGSHQSWKVNKHGAFSILLKTLGLRPSDQSCHHETWLRLDFVDWSNTWPRQNAYQPRISITERLAEGDCGNPKRRISEIMSDHSLSS